MAQSSYEYFKNVKEKTGLKKFDVIQTATINKKMDIFKNNEENVPLELTHSEKLKNDRNNEGQKEIMQTETLIQRLDKNCGPNTLFRIINVLEQEIIIKIDRKDSISKVCIEEGSNQINKNAIKKCLIFNRKNSSLEKDFFVDADDKKKMQFKENHDNNNIENNDTTTTNSVKKKDVTTVAASVYEKEDKTTTVAVDKYEQKDEITTIAEIKYKKENDFTTTTAGKYKQEDEPTTIYQKKDEMTSVTASKYKKEDEIFTINSFRNEDMTNTVKNEDNFSTYDYEKLNNTTSNDKTTVEYNTEESTATVGETKLVTYQQNIQILNKSKEDEEQKFISMPKLEESTVNVDKKNPTEVIQENYTQKISYLDTSNVTIRKITNGDITLKSYETNIMNTSVTGIKKEVYTTTELYKQLRDLHLKDVSEMEISSEFPHYSVNETDTDKGEKMASIYNESLSNINETNAKLFDNTTKRLFFRNNDDDEENYSINGDKISANNVEPYPEDLIQILKTIIKNNKRAHDDYYMKHSFPQEGYEEDLFNRNTHFVPTYVEYPPIPINYPIYYYNS